MHREHCLQQTRVTPDNEQRKPHISYIDSEGKMVKEICDKDITLTNGFIIIKHNNKRTLLNVQFDWSGDLLFKLISHHSSIPITDMKVIVKGKRVDKSNIMEHIDNKTNVMVIGKPVEACEGLDERDIECLMRQVKVDRNHAIMALRKCSSLMDAIIYLGSV